MDDKPIIPFDWQRFFLGEDPTGFYLEIAFRSAFMYLFLLLLLRVLSKRALTQLSILEFGIVIALGSAAGDPTFYKEVPLLHGMIVLCTVVMVQVGYTWLLGHSKGFENAMEGKPVEMIRDGFLVKGALHLARLSQEEFFELLRRERIQQLGEVKQAYLEENGQLSVFLYRDPRPGLMIVPPWDLVAPQELKAGLPLSERKLLACKSCGHTRLQSGELPVCIHCAHALYVPAGIDPLGIQAADQGGHGRSSDVDSSAPGKQ